jgi:hypothetical protein
MEKPSMRSATSWLSKQTNQSQARPKRDATMPRKSAIKPHSPRVLDYSATMSEYERESLAAEAKLKAVRKKKKKRRIT